MIEVHGVSMNITNEWMEAAEFIIYSVTSTDTGVIEVISVKCKSPELIHIISI